MTSTHTNLSSHCSPFLIPKRDLGIMASVFLLVTTSAFFFLWHNEDYLNRLQMTMQVISVAICMVLGLNVSIFVYLLLTKPGRMIPKLQELERTGQIQSTVLELVWLNILTLANFAFLIFGAVSNSPAIKTLAISCTLGIWPLFFLILMNMEGKFTMKFGRRATDPQSFCILHPATYAANYGGYSNVPMASQSGSPVPAPSQPNKTARKEASDSQCFMSVASAPNGNT